MVLKLMTAALALGALVGASIAVAENIAPPRSAPSAAPICAPVAFRIYFAPGSTALDPQARDTIAAASRQVADCDRVEFALAADRRRIADPVARREASERSVVVLNALKARGVEGEVYVQDVSRTVIAAERDAGPDFIEVHATPARAPQLLSSNARQTGL